MVARCLTFFAIRGLFWKYPGPKDIWQVLLPGRRENLGTLLNGVSKIHLPQIQGITVAVKRGQSIRSGPGHNKSAIRRHGDIMNDFISIE